MTGGDGVAEEGAVRCPCGRLLRDPVSRARGLGPVCFRRLHGRTRPRLIGTPTASPHPNAVPVRITTQLAFEIWDEEDDEPYPIRTRRITDVPTGALL